MDLPVDRFCNAVLHWCSKRVKDLDEFRRIIDADPAGGKKAQRAPEANLADFTAFATAVGMTPPDELATE